MGATWRSPFGVALAALVITVIFIRVRCEDLAGAAAAAEAQPAAVQPAMEQARP